MSMFTLHRRAFRLLRDIFQLFHHSLLFHHITILLIFSHTLPHASAFSFSRQQDSYSSSLSLSQNLNFQSLISDSDFGPVFYQEPYQSQNTLSGQPAIYSNESSLIFQCKARGYPLPAIEWRVDNISLTNYKAFVKSQQQQTKQFKPHTNDNNNNNNKHNPVSTFFFPQLNSFVSLTEDGNTLVIGGSRDTSRSGINSYAYHQTQQQQQQQIGVSALHSLECLASNRFGVTISRPVIVEQRRKKCKFTYSMLFSLSTFTSQLNIQYSCSILDLPSYCFLWLKKLIFEWNFLLFFPIFLPSHTFGIFFSIPLFVYLLYRFFSLLPYSYFDFPQFLSFLYFYSNFNFYFHSFSTAAILFFLL